VHLGHLTDAPGYQRWDSGVERVEGSIAPGEKIKVVSKANPGRAFPVKVTEFTPGKGMTWSGGMPLGLFKGMRTFTLAGHRRHDPVHHARGVHRPLLPLIFSLHARPGPVVPAVRQRPEAARRGLRAKAPGPHDRSRARARAPGTRRAPVRGGPSSGKPYLAAWRSRTRLTMRNTTPPATRAIPAISIGPAVAPVSGS
jgi:hypothetical protein